MIKSMLNDARLVAAYASRSAMPVPTEITQTLIGIDEKIRAATCTLQDEQSLNSALARLLELVKPTTLSQIKAEENPTLAHRMLRPLRGRGHYILGAVVNAFGIVLVLVIIPLTTNFNLISVVLSKLNSTDTSQYFEVLRDTTELVRKTERTQPPAAGAAQISASDNSQPMETITIEYVSKRKENLKFLREVDATVTNLGATLSPLLNVENGAPDWCLLVLRIYGKAGWCRDLLDPGTMIQQADSVPADTQQVVSAPVAVDDTEEADDDAKSMQQTAEHLGLSLSAVDQIKYTYLLKNQAESLALILGGSVLPLLYGFLGASVYLMRQFFGEARTEPKFAGGNWVMGRVLLRLGLGGVAGLAIGWFWTPTAAQSVTDITTFTTTPFALAFLAGFSIELLFSILDRIINAISPGVANPA
jgi:hypothetical protein